MPIQAQPAAQPAAQPDIEDVEAAAPPEAADLAAVVAIAERQIAAELVVAELEEKLKAAQAVVKGIAENELPVAMLELGLRGLPLASGHMISVDTTHHASLTDARKPAAFAWLQENGLGDIIKHEISVTFGKGEQEIAAMVVNKLRELAPGHKLTDKEAIHHSTLKSTVDELIASGSPIPFETFGIYTRTVAKITAPSETKSARASRAKPVDAVHGEF